MDEASEEFDFEEWAELARDDPVSYFLKREGVLLQYISAQPERRLILTAIQDAIDARRAIAGTPPRALRDLAGILNEQLQALATRLAQLNQDLEPVHQSTSEPPKTD